MLIFLKLLKELILNGHKIAILGDKIHLKNVYNFGYIKKVELLNKLFHKANVP